MTLPRRHSRPREVTAAFTYCAGAPWVARKCPCLLPRFIAQHEYYVRTLTSIAAMEDDNHELPPKPACGPCCVIL